MKTQLLKIVVGLLSALYLVVPTGGFLEVSPDILPIIGHLDEFAATFLMAWATGRLTDLDLNGDGWIQVAAIAALGIVSVIYLIFPTFGTFEFIPDFIPFVGNIDEAIASLLVITMGNRLTSFAR